MITTFTQYIVAQMRNPHQKFEAIYNKDGSLSGIAAVGKFRQFVYATINKAGSDRVSRNLAEALKTLRDQSNAELGGQPTGWGKLGHERLTFPVRKQETDAPVSIRTRIASLTNDYSDLSDAQIERLHKVECSILLVERLAEGAEAADTSSLVSSRSAMNDAIASGNTDHLFRMRTRAEREASTDEIANADFKSKGGRSSHNDRLVVNSRLELAQGFKRAAFVDEYALVPKKTNGNLHAEVFFNHNKADDVTYTTVQSHELPKPAPAPAVELIPEEPAVELIPEEDDDIDGDQAAINRRVVAEVAKLRESGELRRSKPMPLPAMKHLSVSDDNAIYASVKPKNERERKTAALGVRERAPTIAQKTPEASILVGPVRDDVARYDSDEAVAYETVKRSPSSKSI